MSFMRAVWNIGSIIDLVKLIVLMVKNAVSSEHKLPSQDDIKRLFEIIRKLLESGVIDIPNFDEIKLAESIKQVEDRLAISVEQAESNLVAYGEVRNRYLRKGTQNV